VAGQGRSLDKSEIQSIVDLLRTTDLTIAAIAERMGCSRSAVVTINRKYQVRDYRGRRSTWDTSGTEECRKFTRGGPELCQLQNVHQTVRRFRRLSG